ncbi:hypothetical protein D9M73_143080 [compost metagenome]
MRFATGHRERLFGIGRRARIVAGGFPQDLPDIRADVRQRFLGEQVGGRCGGGHARIRKVRVGIAKGRAIVIRGGCGQALELRYDAGDARLLALKLADCASRIARQIGGERLKARLVLGGEAGEFLDGFWLRLARETGDQLADRSVLLAVRRRQDGGRLLLEGLDFGGQLALHVLADLREAREDA